MRVTTTYELERETHGGKGYSIMELDLTGDWQWQAATRDEPGDNSLSIESVSCGGVAVELTAEEETKITDWWLEDLNTNGIDDGYDEEDDRDEG